ncbi:transporter [Candidatus Moduliflexota bacterium]
MIRKRSLRPVSTLFLHGAFALCLLLAASAAFAPAARAQGSDADLAQELSNPVADLVTIPVQMNYDGDIGPADDGWKLQTNIQPVIPFGVGENWNLITRTILPVIYQDDIFPGAGSKFGLGDVNMTLFLSPKAPTSGGITWGAGPVLLVPTATDSQLGAEKWGAGPAMVALTVRGPWTVGALANHLWSFAGESDRADISNTFVQPFAAYTWPSAWTASVQSETTYNWETEKWSIPVNASIAKLVRWGKLPVSLQAGAGYWVESPDAGPEGLRLRLQANFVLPK